MSVVAIGRTGHTARGRISWLFQDIWLYENGEAELQVEGILEAGADDIVDSIRLFLPLEIEDLEDLSALCGETTFAHGYPRCLLDVYREYEISSNNPKRVRVNGLDASLGAVRVENPHNPGCSEIHLRFEPPITGERRIFRLAMLVKALAVPGTKILPLAQKRMRLYTYGVAPFGGSQVAALMAERLVEKTNVYPVNLHVIQVSFWESVVARESSIPAESEYPEGTCHAYGRLCPPLERQAKRLGVNVEDLKNSSNYLMMWRREDESGTGGTMIEVTFSQSRVQRWLAQHWLSLVAIGLSLSALALAIMRLAGAQL